MSDKRKKASGFKIGNKVIVSGAMMQCSFDSGDNVGGNDYVKLIIKDDKYHTKLDPSKYDIIKIPRGSGNRAYLEYHWVLKESIADFNPPVTVCDGPGGAVAHIFDCVPIENIPLFGGCKSPYYKNALSDMIIMLQAEKKSLESLGDAGKEQRNLIQKKIDRYNDGLYSKTLVTKGPSYGHCVGAFLDRWLNLNSESTKITVNYFMEKSSEIKAKIASVQRLIDQKLYTLLHERDAFPNWGTYKEAGPIWNAAEVKEHWEELDKTFEQLYPAVVSNLMNQTSIDDEEAETNDDPLILYESIKEQIAAFEKFGEDIQENETFQDWSSKWLEVIALYIEAMGIGAKYSTFYDEKEQLNMNSHLICRCGGIISFVHSGQYTLTQTVNFNKMMIDAFTFIENDYKSKMDEEQSKQTKTIDSLVEKTDDWDEYALTEVLIKEQGYHIVDYLYGYTYAHNVVNLFKDVTGNDWVTNNTVVLVQLRQRKDAVEKEVKGKAMKTFYTTAALGLGGLVAAVPTAVVGLLWQANEAANDNDPDLLFSASAYNEIAGKGKIIPSVTNSASWLEYGTVKAINVASNTKTVIDLAKSFMTMAFYEAKDAFMVRMDIAVCGVNTERYYAMDVDQLGNIHGATVSEKRKTMTDLNWGKSKLVENSNLALLYNFAMLLDSTGRTYEFDQEIDMGANG